MSVLTIIFIVALILTVKFAAGSHRHDRHHQHGSVFKALGVTVAVCSLLLFVVIAGIHHFRGRSLAVDRPAEVVDRTLLEIPASDERRASHTAFAPASTQRLSVESDEDPGALGISGPVAVHDESSVQRQSAVIPVAGKDTGDTMLLFVSRKELQKLVEENGGDAIEGLQSAYAMIPLSEAGLQGLPPVLREALSPAALRQMLSPPGLRILTGALAQILALDNVPASEHTESDRVAAFPLMLAEMDIADGPPHELAEWVENPGVGQVVVKSEFLEATTAPEDALRPAIAKALSQRVTQLTLNRFGTNADWEKLVSVSLTNDAIRSCIVSTDALTEIVGVGVEPVSMQKIFALVEFPKAMEEKVLDQVEAAIRQNRLTALCVAVACLWLAAVLFSAACRASQHGTFLKKLATLPVMALLILPCLLAFAFMLGAMIRGATFEFRTEQGRISCVVDRD